MKLKTTAISIKAVLLSTVLTLFNSAYSLSPARQETSDIRDFIGTWVNIDNNTGGIKKIVISKAKSPQIQVFGACSPTACDWGVQRAKAYSYFSSSATSMEATYKSGFAIRDLYLQVMKTTQGKKLTIVTYTHFTDGSGRKDYNSEDKFKQVTIKPIPNKHTAIKQLPRSTRLTSAQIRAKRLAEWYKAHPDKKPKAKKIVKPKPQKSMSQKMPKNCGFGSLYYGKVKYHKGNKAYYLTVKDRYAKNTSEDFELSQFASPKLLNRYVVLYGGQLVGGRVLPDFNGAISGKVLQVVNNHQVNFKKLKAFCATK